MGGVEKCYVKFTYCYIISLGGEGGAIEEKVEEKVEDRGAPFRSNARPW